MITGKITYKGLETFRTSWSSVGFFKFRCSLDIDRRTFLFSIGIIYTTIVFMPLTFAMYDRTFICKKLMLTTIKKILNSQKGAVQTQRSGFMLHLPPRFF